MLTATFDSTTGQWTSPESLTGSAQLTATSPSIAVEPDGNAIAVWLQNRDDQVNELRWARYVTGAGWLREPNSIAALQRDTGSSFDQTATVAMDGEGRAIASWSQQGEIWGAVYE